MTFLPVNDDHAVANCQFAVGLSRSLSGGTIQALLAAHPGWMQTMPAIASGTADDMVADAITPLKPPRSKNALLSAFMRPDGSATWALRIFCNQIDLACTRYTRWDPTWDVAKSVMAQVLSVVSKAEKDVRVSSVALKVVDHFLAREGYSLDELFKSDSWLVSKVFGVGDYWHSHLGWFEREGADRILNQVDFDAQERVATVTDGQPDTRINIAFTHTLQHRFSSESQDSASDLTPEANQMSAVERSMIMLHNRNKAMLLDVLQPKMAARIGLRIS
jgi:uncharacterized protein (TIGR04255 family)